MVRRLLEARMNLGGSVRVNPVGVAVITAIVLLLIFFNSGGSTKASVNTVNLKQLLSVAISAAEKGGERVVAIRKSADLQEESKGETLEGANDPKTQGDMQSHIAMYYGIRKAFPDLNVISEEHGESTVDLGSVEALATSHPEVDKLIGYEVPVEEVAVWIDPLDATQEYTENLQEYVTTMVCVAVKGVPTIGVVHKPFSQTTAWGWVGEGVSATVQEEFAANKDLKRGVEKARVIVSRSHPGPVRANLETALGKGINITNAGGAGYKAMEVVRGSQDAYVHVTLIKKWDICAPQAILASLQDGRLTDLTGGEIDYSRGDQPKTGMGVLATLRHHKDFVDKLKDEAFVEELKKSLDKRLGP